MMKAETNSSSGKADGQYPCEECASTFASSKALREHVAQHKWGPHTVLAPAAAGESARFQCLFEGCGKIVKDRKVLRKHCLTHRPREFACEDCGKRFYERAKLKRHMLVHTGEKEFACSHEGCDKTFAYKANVLTHMRTHTGHRPYKCTWAGCNKSFAQASNRNSHVLTHSANKRKRCKLSSVGSAADGATNSSTDHSEDSDDSGAGKQRKVQDVGSPRQQQSQLALLEQVRLAMAAQQQQQQQQQQQPPPAPASAPATPQNAADSKLHIPIISPSAQRDTIASLLMLSGQCVNSDPATAQPQQQQPQQQQHAHPPPTSAPDLSSTLGAGGGKAAASNQQPMTIPISPAGAQALSPSTAAGGRMPTLSSLVNMLGNSSPFGNANNSNGSSSSNNKAPLSQPSLLFGSAPSSQQLSFLSTLGQANSGSTQQLFSAAGSGAMAPGAANNSSGGNNASLLLQALLNKRSEVPFSNH